MARKRHTPEQIIAKLREIEVDLAKGMKTRQACRTAGISEHTYYKWKKQCGGIRIDQAKRLKELEQENVRLKKLVAKQALDISILKEVTRGNF